MKFKIVNMGSEEFWKYRGRGRLKKVPGTKTVLKRVDVHSTSRGKPEVAVRVRGKTSFEVAATARALLGIPRREWHDMVASYVAASHQLEHEAARRREKYEAQKLNRLVRAGERAKKRLEKKR